MGRRKKSGPAHFMSEELKARVTKLMDNRRRLLAPFPVDARAVYDAGWSAGQHAAMNLLFDSNPGMFRMGKSIRLRFRANERDYNVAVTMEEERPMCDFRLELLLKDLPMSLKEPIAHWIPQWWKLHREQAQLIAKVNDCGRICKTYGQLHRLWPDILSLFDGDGREKIGSAKVRSALPEGAFKWEDDEQGNRVGTLREGFEPAAFTPFTAMIAECLMLPEREIVEVAKIDVAR
jgi:hypothetical protein